MAIESIRVGVAACVIFSGTCVFGVSPEIKHSEKAKVLFKQFDAATADDLKEFAEKVGVIQVVHDKAARERKKTLIATLEKIQDEETKAGNLEAAVEVKEAIKVLTYPLAAPPTKLSPAEIRAMLVDTSWWHDAKNNRKNAIRLHADGSVTTSWHKLPSMWSVLPDGTVQLMYTKTRSVRRMRVDSKFRTGTGIKDGWLYLRIGR